MKLLSVTVPCYNSEGYMARCVDSLLAGGDDMVVPDLVVKGALGCHTAYLRLQKANVIHPLAAYGRYGGGMVARTW